MSRVFVYEWCCATARGDDPRAASLLPEGSALLAAALSDFCRLSDVAVRTILNPSMRDHPTVVEATTRLERRGLTVEWTSDEAAAFTEAAADADFALVIAPESDEILEVRCRWAVEAGANLLGPTPEAVRLTADKLLLARHFRRHGVRTPVTDREYELILSNYPPPFVVKHRCGAGSDEMLICTDAITARDVWYEAAGLGDLIVQPLVSGLPASVSFLVGPRRTHPLPATEQFVTVPGNFRYLGGRTPIVGPLAERALYIARQAVECVAGLNGYVGVDVVLGKAADGSRDHVIEINPRMTTSYLGLRALCEDNLMELLLRLVHGESAAKPRWRRGSVSWTPDGQIQPAGAPTDIAPA